MKPPEGLRLDAGPLHQLIQQPDGTYRMGPAVGAGPDIAFQITSWPDEAILGKDQLGLILSGSIGPGADGRPTSLASPTAQELRHYCLLWDRLDYPSHDDGEVLADPDLAFLKSEGILVRTLFSYMATPAMRAKMLQDGGLIAGPAQAFSEAEQRQPGQWALARPDDGATFRNADLELGRGVLFRLHNAIPVPTSDVPLADVLEFKAKRQAELAALREELAAVYLAIISSPDPAMTYRAQLSRLDRAISAAVKVSKESKLPFTLASPEAKLNGQGWQHGVTTFGTLTAAGFPLAAAALAGVATAITSTVNMTVGLRKARPTGSPFEYVTKYSQELLR